LDTPRFLGERGYLADDHVVLQVDDPLGIGGGRFALEGGPQGATCRETHAAADLRLSMLALSAISLGGVSLNGLQQARLVEEERPGGLERGERLFRWPVAPWCSTFF